MATEGKIVNLESSSNEALFPRTKVKAISDDNNVGLEVLLEGKADTNEVVPITRTINNKALSSNISLTAADVGARPSSWVPSISDLGVTATAAELNYVDGVTSNIQTQLNAKVPTSRTVNGKALSSNISLTAADVGAMPSSPRVEGQPSAPGWYRIGTVLPYDCYRLTVSSSWGTTRDMSVIVDIATTYSSASITKVVSGYTHASYEVIDKIRLVKGSNLYYVDIHYTQSTINSVYVRLDGAAGRWTTYADWVTASDSATAVATCVMSPYVTLTSAEYGTSLPAAGNAGRIFFKKVT